MMMSYNHSHMELSNKISCHFHIFCLFFEKGPLYYGAIQQSYSQSRGRKWRKCNLVNVLTRI